MGLNEYRRKRDFDKTTEPPANERRSAKNLRFVVQKHDATRLHYDFRLEFDGVLKSWAVPRGPSLDPAVKSLAVEVEDHPVDYAGFEGIIPAGEYGGGTVIVWDRGGWRPVGDPHAQFRKGHLEFELTGERLRGRWHLIRIRKEGKRQNWLLMKGKDEEAVEGDAHGLTDRELTSVVTGRTIPDVADSVQGGSKKNSTRSVSQTKTRSVKPVGQKSKARSWKAASRKSAAPTSTAKKSSTGRKKPSAKKRAADPGSKSRSETPRAVRRVSRHPSQVDTATIAGSRAKPFPLEFRPQLATLAPSVPQTGDWLHEIKFDGYRLVAMIDDGAVRLLTRTGLDWTARFPSLMATLESLPLRSGILDGELVANDEHGRSSFQRLQKALKEGDEHELVYYAFDLPYLDGRDLTRCSLRDRKAALQQLLKHEFPKNDSRVRSSDHIEGDGQQVLDEACRASLEGIICKDARSPYESRRTRTWLKVKCHGRQELIICGFSRPERSRVGFGALLLGYYEGRQLRYAGRVGTGFDGALLRSLSKRLRALAIENSPFAEPLPAADRRGVTYVRQELVCEVEFTEWTEEGRLRHSSFQGLREEKPAREVVRERPAPTGSEQTKAIDMATSRPKKTRPRKSSSRKTGGESRSDNGPIQLEGVTITHPDRVLFPDDGITKGDLARYMAHVANWILPHVADRPLTIVRCPEGTTGECFYQKHWTRSLPSGIHSVAIKEKSKTARYLVVRDVQGLLSLIQISALELHPWGAKTDRVETPDRIVFDLDPGPGVEWSEVCQGARDVRATLDELGLESFVRTSGGKGLHVVLPLQRRNSWDEVTEFSRAIASGLSRHAPDRFVANMRKNLRSGKIFVDYLRNQRGATAIASYSMRARPGCPVAVPLAWDELDDLSGGDAFNIRSVPERLRTLKRDPWEALWASRQSLSKKVLTAADRFAE